MTPTVSYYGPLSPAHGKDVFVKINLGAGFDTSIFPKSLRIRSQVSMISFTPSAENSKNEAGLKRLRRALAILAEYEVKMDAANSLTEKDFFSRIV